MRYLHTMIRVLNLERALRFFIDQLGLIEVRRKESEKGRFSLIFLATEPGAPEIELTYNWDQEKEYTFGRNFGHLAFEVDNIYDYCESLQKKGIQILRPPRDGHMAFIKSPDNISIELLQKGKALTPCEPWHSMPNQGDW